MTHERDPGENLSFFARAKPPHSTLHFPSCGSLVLSLSLLLHCIFLFFALEEVLLSSMSRHSPSSFGSSLPFPPTSLPFSLSLLLSFFLIPLLSPPSFFSTSALLRLPPPRLSINLFFSLRSSGPRNEQRKSIGWHCGFVPSTVVLDRHMAGRVPQSRVWSLPHHLRRVVVVVVAIVVRGTFELYQNRRSF